MDGLRNGVHGKAERSVGGDRGNTPQVRERLRGRRVQPATPTPAGIGVMTESYSGPCDKHCGSNGMRWKDSNAGREKCP